MKHHGSDSVCPRAGHAYAFHQLSSSRERGYVGLPRSLALSLSLPLYICMYIYIYSVYTYTYAYIHIIYTHLYTYTRAGIGMCLLICSFALFHAQLDVHARRCHFEDREVAAWHINNARSPSTSMNVKISRVGIQDGNPHLAT